MTEAGHVPQDLLEHAAFLRRLVRTLLADAHAAEDVVQETWTRGLQRPPTRGGDLRAWLARVARNFAYRERRTELRRGARERDSARPEELPPAEATLEHGETLQRVVEAVRALEEPYRAAILARFYEDLPPRAIAAREGVSVETVNTRLKRALAQLRRTLARDQRDWRGALGLLAGRSPCLPSPVGLSIGGALMKMKVIAVLVAGVLALWGLSELAEPGPPPAAPVVAASQAPRPEPSGGVERIPAGEREPAPSTVAPETVLSGRVVDELGAPLEAAVVDVLAERDPFGEDPGTPDLVVGTYRGRHFATDADGKWRAVLPAPMRVLVRLGPDERIEESVEVERRADVEHVLITIGPASEGGNAQWVDAPAANVDFVVRRVPTGTLEVRVVEGAGRVPLGDFRITLQRAVELDPEVYRFFRSQRAMGPVLRSEVRVDDPGGVPLRVALIEPEVGNLWSKLLGEPGRLEQDVHLLPGETEQVLFVLPERGVLRGQVVDPLGAPVANALVYFGPQARARGDEPFKPFREERIIDGARTAADGWFELRGDGAEVTVGHADFSSVTVEARQASRIVLGARGALRGRLLDESGRGLEQAHLRLDDPRKGPEGTTGPDGRFAFERVEAGAHAIWLERELLAAVRLEPGEEAELELGAATQGRLELALPSDAAIDPGQVRGLLVGFERVFGVYEVEVGPDPATLVVPHAVRPGRYWFVTSTGISASLTVEPGSEHLEVALGQAELRVHAAKRINAQLVPADADAFVRLAAARAYVKVEGEAGVLFRVHPGRYLLVGEAGAILRELDVPPEGAVVRLE